MTANVYSDGPEAIVEDFEGSSAYYLRKFHRSLVIDAGAATWYHELPLNWWMP